MKLIDKLAIQIEIFPYDKSVIFRSKDQTDSLRKKFTALSMVDDEIVIYFEAPTEKINTESSQGLWLIRSLL